MSSTAPPTGSTPAARATQTVPALAAVPAPAVPPHPRTRLIRLVRETAHLLLTTAVIGGVALLISRLELPFSTAGLITILSAALIAAALYLPLRRFLQIALDIVFGSIGLDSVENRRLRAAVADLQRINAEASGINARLESARGEAIRLDSVKTDFVTIASHELRTPLSQVRGYTDILDSLNENGMLDQNQAASLVGNLRKAVDRMEELVTAMLDVSQLDVNAMDLRFSPVTVESALRMAIEPLHDAIRQRKMTLAARGLKGLPAIEADQQRLVQALRNVVVNAIKFTPDGGRIEITGSLVAATPQRPAQILIAIADTGVGIAPENLTLIFRKFFRAADPALHSTGAYKFMGAGPGLGLTIAQGVIAGHGGQIWAESPGFSREALPGATFYILLPLRQAANAQRALSMQSPHGDDLRQTL